MGTAFEDRVNAILKTVGVTFYRMEWQELLDVLYGKAGDELGRLADEITDRHDRLAERQRRVQAAFAREQAAIEAGVKDIERMASAIRAEQARAAEQKGGALTIEEEGWLRGALVSPAHKPPAPRPTAPPERPTRGRPRKVTIRGGKDVA